MMYLPSSITLCWSVIIVFGLSALTFHNSRNGDFVFDDYEAILNNQDVSGELSSDTFFEIFSHDFWGTRLTSKTSHKSYRPFTVITFRLNTMLAGGLFSEHFHLVNIVLHCIVSSIFIVFVSVLLGDGHSFQSDGSFLFHCPEISTLSAVLFAVLPVHTESVAGVVGRADLLCSICFMLALIFYAKAVSADTCCKKVLFYVVNAVLVVSSVLCKEPGLTVLGVCSVFDFLVVCGVDVRQLIGAIKTSFATRTCTVSVKSSNLLRQLYLVSLGGMVFLLRWNLMGSSAPVFQPVDNPHSFVNSTLLKIVNYNYIYALNSWLLINPTWLCFDWSMGCVPVINTLADYRVSFVFLFWMCLALILWCSLFLLQPREQRRVLIAMSLVVIPFLPASNLLFRVGFVIAERNLYLPSTGFVILVALGIHTLYHRSPRLIFVMLSILVATNVCRCLQRAAEWTNEQRLYESALGVCPLNAKVHYNVAKIHADKGNVDIAIEMYKEAIRLYPEYDQALNNLGNLHKDRGQLEQAKQLLNQAVIARPEFAAAWMNLGIVQAELKQFAQAELSYQMALRHRRRYPDCYYNLGNLYLEVERFAEALAAWNNATRLQPTHVNAWTNSILLLGNLARYDDLDTLVNDALHHNPNESSFHFHYASSLGRAGQFETSETHFLSALQLAKQTDNIASYHANLAVLYHRWGKLLEAQRYYQNALRLEPNNNQTVENYRLLQRKLSRLQEVESLSPNAGTSPENDISP